MRKSARICLGLGLVLVSAGAVAQTTVTTSGTTSSGTVPVFNGTATVTNSPISVSGSNVGIGTTAPNASLEIHSNSNLTGNTKFGNVSATVTPGSYASGGSSGQGYGLISNTTFANQGAWANIALIQNSTNANDISAGTYLSIHGWYQNSATSLPIALGGGYSNINPSIFIAAGNGSGGGSVGIGTTAPGAKLEVNGGLRFTNDPAGAVQTTAWTGVLCGGDYAEAMKTAGEKKSYEPGDVLVLTDDSKGDVRKSSEPYSTMVAGIYATKPGVIGQRQSLKDATDQVPMAMVGVVPTKVTAENGAIHRGDLLVSSSIPGYAMKGTDRSRLVGAVIGKAMGTLDSGQGVIEVLVTLQ